jgi:hypothetical protein
VGKERCVAVPVPEDVGAAWDDESAVRELAAVMTTMAVAAFDERSLRITSLLKCTMHQLYCWWMVLQHVMHVVGCRPSDVVWQVRSFEEAMVMLWWLLYFSVQVWEHTWEFACP